MDGSLGVILSELVILPDINEMNMLAGIQLFPDVGNVYFTDLLLRLLDKLQKCRTVLHSCTPKTLNLITPRV